MPEAQTPPSDDQESNSDQNSESGFDSGLSKLAELEAQVKEKENKFLYLYADFDNYKKRAERDRIDQQKYGWKPLALDLVQVLDNLERGLKHAPAGTDASLLSGLQIVHKQLTSALEKQGIQIVSTDGKLFDPNLHEAVGQAASDQPVGSIVQVEQRGYLMNGRLLRPARVIVASASDG